MTYEQLLDAIFDLILGDLSDEEAETKIESLLSEQSEDLVVQIRETLASLFTSENTSDDKANQD
jgi:hypothetical protein